MRGSGRHERSNLSYPRFGSDFRKFRGLTGDHNVYVRGAAVNTRPHVTSLGCSFGYHITSNVVYIPGSRLGAN